MTKSKTDKHLTLSYKKTISKSDYTPLKVGKIDRPIRGHAAKEKNKQIK